MRVNLAVWDTVAPTHAVSAVYVTRDRQHIATGTKTGQLAIWSFEQDKIVPNTMTLLGSAAITCITGCYRDNTHDLPSQEREINVVCSLSDGSVVVVDPIDGSVTQFVRKLAPGTVRSMTAIGHEHFVGLAGDFPGIYVVHLSTMKTHQFLVGHIKADWHESLDEVEFRTSTDGEIAAGVLSASSSGFLCLHDLQLRGAAQESVLPAISVKSTLPMIRSVRWSRVNRRVVVIAGKTSCELRFLGDLSVLARISTDYIHPGIDEAFFTSFSNLCIFSKDGKYIQINTSQIYSSHTNDHCVWIATQLTNEERAVSASTTVHVEGKNSFDLEGRVSCHCHVSGRIKAENSLIFAASDEGDIKAFLLPTDGKPRTRLSSVSSFQNLRLAARTTSNASRHEAVPATLTEQDNSMMPIAQKDQGTDVDETAAMGKEEEKVKEGESDVLAADTQDDSDEQLHLGGDQSLTSNDVDGNRQRVASICDSDTALPLFAATKFAESWPKSNKRLPCLEDGDVLSTLISLNTDVDTLDQMLVFGLRNGDIVVCPLSHFLWELCNKSPKYEALMQKSPLLRVHAHQGQVRVLFGCQEPHSSWFVSGGTDSSICIWDVFTLKRVACFQHQCGEVVSIGRIHERLPGYSSCIFVVSTDHSITIYDVARKTVRSRFSGHPFPIQRISWLPEDEMLCVTLTNGSIYLWHLNGTLDGTASSVSAQRILMQTVTGWKAPQQHTTAVSCVMSKLDEDGNSVLILHLNLEYYLQHLDFLKRFYNLSILDCVAEPKEGVSATDARHVQGGPRYRSGLSSGNSSGAQTPTPTGPPGFARAFQASRAPVTVASTGMAPAPIPRSLASPGRAQGSTPSARSSTLASANESGPETSPHTPTAAGKGVNRDTVAALAEALRRTQQQSEEALDDGRGVDAARDQRKQRRRSGNRTPSQGDLALSPRRKSSQLTIQPDSEEAMTKVQLDIAMCDFILSLVMWWREDCDDLLKLLAGPSDAVQFGVMGALSKPSVILPCRPHNARWSVSPLYVTTFSFVIYVLINAFSDLEHRSEYKARWLQVMPYFLDSLRECGRHVSPSHIHVVAKYYQHRRSELSEATKVLVKHGMDSLRDSEKRAFVAKLQAETSASAETITHFQLENVILLSILADLRLTVIDVKSLALLVHDVILSLNIGLKHRLLAITALTAGCSVMHLAEPTLTEKVLIALIRFAAEEEGVLSASSVQALSVVAKSAKFALLNSFRYFVDKDDSKYFDALLKFLLKLIEAQPMSLFPIIDSVAKLVIKSLDPNAPVKHQCAPIARDVLSIMARTYPMIATAGAYFVLGTEEGNVVVFDLKSSTVLKTIGAYRTPISAVCVDKKGTKIFCYSLAERSWKSFQLSFSLFGVLGCTSKLLQSGDITLSSTAADVMDLGLRCSWGDDDIVAISSIETDTHELFAGKRR